MIIRWHSAVSWPKSEARTEGEMIARGIEAVLAVNDKVTKRLRQ